MYRSSFTVVPEHEGATHEGLLRMFARRLEEVRARNVTVEENIVSFKKGWMFRLTGNWNLLGSITGGRIELEPETNRVTYSLSFKHLVVVGTVMAGFVAAFMAAGGLPFFCGLPLTWLWGVGMSYLVSLARFDRFMKRCIRDAGFVVRRSQKDAGQRPGSKRFSFVVL